jgi:hypothetical protein
MKRWNKIGIAVITSLMLCSCTNYKTMTGSMKEPVKTMFYTFTVNDCYSTKAIQQYTPSENKLFVVVNITIENLYKGKLDMTDAHFQMQTIDSTDSSSNEGTVENGVVATTISTTAAADYFLPITQTVDTAYLTDELPSSYTMEKGESRSGTLIFEMPNTDTIYNFCTADYFNYGTSGDTVTGNTYFVEVTPEAK